MLDQSVDISQFLSGEKVKSWPSKDKFKEAIRYYFSTKVEPGKKYTEREINELFNKYHTFSDPALIRRELCDHGLLKRDKYGYQYWKD